MPKRRGAYQPPYSKHSFLVHGKFLTSKWDFEHHVVPPISSSSTYRLESAQRGASGFCGYVDPQARARRRGEIFIYDRLDEPTRAMLEERLAFVEEGERCVTFATGMAAIAAALGVVLRSGDEVVAHHALYGCTYSLLTTWMPRMGIRARYVDFTDPRRLERAIGRRTRAVLFETPVNPTLEVIDIAAVAGICRRRGVISIVDNTFATPFCQRPLSLGADMVVHSLTKNICGFGTDMGGAVVTRRQFEGDLLLYRKDFGGVLSPKNAWPILVYGLPSLELRMRKEEQNALEVARFLEGHPKVARVVYPGLESFPQRALARRQMTDFDGTFAPSNMIYFVVKGGEPAASRLVNHCARHAYTITLAVSLGQIRTLIEMPTAMTHSALPAGARRAGHLDPGGVRLSVGIEDAGDLIHDLREALQTC
ncbi:MAG TPA: aminotransferase class I/II-fold pyridoxal phosphate-dependent enzyme [Planctomycetota bacterium]|nr:aminotransferase class I/II-fold pyridoxal phosphate-dependent enzyme [Planctomycetota bacterium]